MANEPDEPEVIRHQMEETRASLAEKLETLENQVVQTVQGATSAVNETVASVKDVVQETVQTVKGSVEDTVETVKTTFDLRRQTERHPWFMVGGAVAAGFAAGHLVGRLGGAAQAASTAFAPASASWSPPANGLKAPAREQPPAPRQEPGFLDELGQTFGAEVAKVKGLAIGALLGIVRDLIARSVPDKVGPQVNELMDSVTTKLGGRPIAGPVVEGDLQEMLFGREADRGRSREPEAGRPLGPTAG